MSKWKKQAKRQRQFLTETYGLQLLQVDRELQCGGLALTAPAGQRCGQAGGGRAQEGILQEVKDGVSAVTTFYHAGI